MPQNTEKQKEYTAQMLQSFFTGKIDEIEMERFLVTLSERGETASELSGALEVIQAIGHKIKAPADALDCCGTGGDGMHSLNISTGAAFVVSAAGLPMAKHGNRAASSQSGSSDVLEALGIRLDAPREVQEKALFDIGVCFLMAPLYHPELAKLSAIRKRIGRKTLFNLVGPMANPAQVKNQMIGVFAKRWLHPLSQALKERGHKNAWIVHSRDGFDEVSIFAPTDCSILKEGNISNYVINPKAFDIPAYKPELIRGGDADYNAKQLRSLFEGDTNDRLKAYKDMVCLNSAVCLLMMEHAQSLGQGFEMAHQLIDNGCALEKLNALIKATQSH